MKAFDPPALAAIVARALTHSGNVERFADEHSMRRRRTKTGP